MISYRYPDISHNFRDPDYDSEETPGKTQPLFNARESMKKGVGNDKSEINRNFELKPFETLWLSNYN